MKKKIFISFLVALLGVGLTSCEDFLGGDLNADPNRALEVPIGAILSGVEIELVDVTGGSFSRWNCMWTQQVEGVARQWSAFNQYGITPNRYDDAWDNLYERVFVEIQEMVRIATEDELNHYLGVTNVLLAYGLLMATDHWGDIPYTEAFQGIDNISPVYDSQSGVIYPEIFRLLGDAISLFAQPAGAVAPGSDDVIYGGDISLWLKAAYGIRARANLHQGNYAAALADAQNSFAAIEESFSYQYDQSNAAGWFRFNRDRTGDLQHHPTMAGIMTGLNDTVRLAQFAPTFEEHETQPYMVADFLVDLVSYREMQFLIAETLLREGGNAAAIRTAYLAGIAAAFANAGVPEAYADYVSQAAVDPGVGNITLDQIMTQKYIGLYVQPEVFSDWRRTGIPALTPVSGTEVPRRYLYPQDENLFNTNTPDVATHTLFSPPVDWDTN